MSRKTGNRSRFRTWKKWLGGCMAACVFLTAPIVPAYADETPVPIEITTQTTSKSPLERLANCSVTMTKDGAVRTEAFKQEATTIGYSVVLDDEIPTGRLTAYAYPGTVSLDPDSAATKKLASTTVQNGDTGTLSVDLTQIPVGYKVQLGIYVNIDGDDWYRTVAGAQVFEVVDEIGTGFTNYTYPNVTIDETELKAGTESLHISITGDERMFTYAKEGKITMAVSIGQYPDGEDFDFEGENQISLYSMMPVTEAFSGKEMTLSEPLREGYRVRAVVYWSQNIDLFIPKGNDYESIFNLPDDSVLIAAADVPEEADTTPDFTIGFNGTLTTETTDATLQIAAKTGMEDTALTMVALCRVDESGRTDVTSSSSYISRVFGKSVGEVTLTDISGLRVGERVRFVIRYFVDGEMKDVESRDYTVIAPIANDSLIIQETSFAKADGDATASVTIAGCADYVDKYLFLSTGPVSTNGNGDSRTRLGTQKFTGDGTYTFTFDASNLKGGETIQAYLYRYDWETDRTYYLYSNAVAIEKEETQAKTTIETRTIDTDTKTLYVSAAFDGSALLTLYASDTADFDATALTDEERADYIGIKYLASAPASSTDVSLTKDLTAGKYITVAIWQNGISGTLLAQSTPKLIAAAPEKITPTAVILTNKITAGMTKVRASLQFDSRASSVSYALYQFNTEALDTETAEVLSTGKIFTSSANREIYTGSKLKEGYKLQLVLSADGVDAYSQQKTVEASPDWGTPTVSIDAESLSVNDTTIPVVVDYSDEYLTMGDEFYCDVTVYSVPDTYTDEMIEDQEIWEKSWVAKAVAKANSLYKDTTKGTLNLPLLSGKSLEAGTRLFVKLRLPHTEWEDEEVDYVSASVAVEAEVPTPAVYLYHLGAETETGAQLRAILTKLDVEVYDVQETQLNQKVGYIIGRDGYEKNDTPYAGGEKNTEFMLMANFSDALLDEFLDAMKGDSVYIAHKAITTETNVTYEFHQLIDDIVEEHETFQLILELDEVIKKAELLSEETYGEHEKWAELQTAIETGNAVLAQEEASAEELQDAIDTLNSVYEAVYGEVVDPETKPVDETKPIDETKPVDETKPIDETPIVDPEIPVDGKYTMKSGENQVVTAGAEITFSSYASFEKFVKVQMDGQDLDPQYYTAKAGSTVITLLGSYVKTLSEGSHSLAIVSEDGVAETGFRVQSAAATDNQTTGETTGQAEDNQTTGQSTGEADEVTKAEQAANQPVIKPISVKTTKQAAKTTASGATQTPKTGDDTPISVLMTMLLLSGFGLLQLARKKMKK